MRVEWDNFKSFVDDRRVSIQYVLIDDTYWLKAFDGLFALETTIYKKVTPDVGGPQEDFENNYLSASNATFTDGDGSQLSRNKMAPKGWSYQIRAIELKTSSLNSLVNKDFEGTDDGFATLKFFDNLDVELTTQNDIDTDCVKTQLDWMPSWDYELLGGWMSMTATTTENIRLHAVGAPGLADIVMIQNINARFLGQKETLTIDGRTPKRMKYDNPVPGTGKLRLMWLHNVGIQCDFQLTLEYYKP